MAERPERCQWVPILFGASGYYTTVAARRSTDNKVIGMCCRKHQTIDFVATILQTLKVCVHKSIVLWERQRAIVSEAELKGLRTSLQLGHSSAADVQGGNSLAGRRSPRGPRVAGGARAEYPRYERKHEALEGRLARAA